MRPKRAEEQLKVLAQLKARESLKETILANYPQAQKREGISWGIWRTATIAVLVVSFGSLWYNSLKALQLEESSYRKLAQINNLKGSLIALETRLAFLQKSVNNINNPRNLLVLKEPLKKTLVYTQEYVSEAKKKDGALAVHISRTEKRVKELEKTYLDKEKELAYQLIVELGARSMTPEQKQRLELAKELWSQGQYSESLEVLLELK